MTQLTGVTLCSGGGGSALGLAAAGVQPVGAVEYDAAIAAQYAANLGPHVTVATVQDVDYRQWAGVDVLQASPPCPNFSNAKHSRQEGALDLAIAEAICRAIRTIRPRAFWLENVEGYANSQSYRLIRAALDELDYWSHATVVNAADMGVAQTRRRLILRAVSGGLWQPFRPLPAPVPWIGWYAAIADLLDTLPASEFADWQLRRLPGWLAQSVLVDGMNARTEAKGGLNLLSVHEPALTVPSSGHGLYRAFLVNSSNSVGGAGIAVYGPDAPGPCVRTGLNHRPSAFIVDCQDSRAQSGLTIREAGEPMFTVSASMDPRRPARAFIVEGSGNTWSDPNASVTVRNAGEPMFTVRAARENTRAWLDCGRVVKMTPRALARFQSFPDTYQLPENNALACRVIGNAVPPLVAQAITASLIVPERSAPCP